MHCILVKYSPNLPPGNVVTVDHRLLLKHISVFHLLPEVGLPPARLEASHLRTSSLCPFYSFILCADSQRKVFLGAGAEVEFEESNAVKGSGWEKDHLEDEMN